MGILVRSTDKVSRLKNLLEKPGRTGETRLDTWRDLAGYALQALILLKKVEDFFDLRRARLLRGFCPDCGSGALLRLQTWHETTTKIFCSNNCGFEVDVSLREIQMDTTEVIHRLAAREAVREQG
jgi:hypothetical protein